MKLRFDGRDQPRCTVTETDAGYQLSFDWERYPDMWLHVHLVLDIEEDVTLNVQEHRVDMLPKT